MAQIRPEEQHGLPREVVHQCAVALLALAHCLLGAFALGDVLYLTYDVERPALGVTHHSGAQVSPNEFATFGDESLLELIAVDLAGQRSTEQQEIGTHVIRIRELRKRLAVELLLGIARHLGQWTVHLQGMAVSIYQHHAGGCRLECRAETCFALSQRLLRSLALGDVATAGLELDNMAFRVADGMIDPLLPANRAIGSDGLVLVGRRTRLRHHGWLGPA